MGRRFSLIIVQNQNNSNLNFLLFVVVVLLVVVVSNLLLLKRWNIFVCLFISVESACTVASFIFPAIGEDCSLVCIR